jgi:hypothetical protein
MEAREPGCQETESGEPGSDLDSAYIDVFCTCHHYTEPKILTHGTDIAWPAGWSQEQVNTWRAGARMSPPVVSQVAVGEALPQAGPQSDPNLVNLISTAGSGVLADPSNPTQNDEAPTG